MSAIIFQSVYQTLNTLTLNGRAKHYLESPNLETSLVQIFKKRLNSCVTPYIALPGVNDASEVSQTDIYIYIYIFTSHQKLCLSLLNKRNDVCL